MNPPGSGGGVVFEILGRVFGGTEERLLPFRRTRKGLPQENKGGIRLRSRGPLLTTRQILASRQGGGDKPKRRLALVIAFTQSTRIVNPQSVRITGPPAVGLDNGRPKCRGGGGK